MGGEGAVQYPWRVTKITDALVHARRNVAGGAGIGDGRAFARADLADAIEIGIVKLARQVLADDAVGESHVLAAEMRGGSEIEIRLAAPAIRSESVPGEVSL